MHFCRSFVLIQPWDDFGQIGLARVSQVISQHHVTTVEKVVILEQGRLFVSRFWNTYSFQLLHICFLFLGLMLFGACRNTVNLDILTGQSLRKVLHLSLLQIAKLLIYRLVLVISAATQSTLNHIWNASCRIACRLWVARRRKHLFGDASVEICHLNMLLILCFRIFFRLN